MATKKYSLFLDKFPLQLESWKEQQKAKGKPGSQYEFARQVGVEPYYVTDWKTGRHGIPYLYIEKICEVLGVSTDVYEPRTHSEKYQYSSDFITDIGKAHVEFANKEGLDLTLVEALTKIVDFNKTFPVYTPIRLNTQFLDPEYIRMINADSAPIDKKLEFLQVTRDGKRITLHRADLAFLKEVQDRVTEYVEYLFYRRAQEMKDELTQVNKDLHITLKDGGQAVKKITREYIETIDRFNKYHVEDLDPEEGSDISGKH